MANTTANVPGVTRKTFTINAANNRLTAIDGVAVGYDSAGNQTTISTSGQPDYELRDYDAENRMTRAAKSGVTSYYHYDGSGRRVRRIIGGAETWQVCGFDGELIAEYNVSGTFSGSNAPAATSPVKEYGYRSGQMLVVFDSTQTGDEQLAWLLQDHLGSTRMIVNRSGSLAGMKRRDYLPFGEELAATIGHRAASGSGYVVDDKPRQKFAGYERDNETGLDYVQARYLSSAQGRFTSVDPVTQLVAVVNPQNWNRYAYALNNPLAYVDKNGKWPTHIHSLILELALPGLSREEILAVQRGSANTDWDISHTLIPYTLFEPMANQHAMRRSDQTIEQAQQGYQSFVKNLNGYAIAAQEYAESQGETAFGQGAMYYFGKSSHAVMDNTSPAHAPFQLYQFPSLTGNSAIDAMLLYTWKKEMDAHAAAEATITDEQLVNAVLAVRENFRQAFGEERYRRAVPGVYQYAWFFFLDTNRRQRVVNGGDLGTITIHADGRQDYEGPLKPRKRP